MTQKRYVRIPKFAAETGYTEKAVRRKIEEGVWLEGAHYLRAPDGTIHMEMGAYYLWLESQSPAGSSRPATESKSGSRGGAMNLGRPST